MKRINVMVSDEAKENLIAYQRHFRLTTQDEALDKILVQLKIPKEQTFDFSRSLSS